MDVEPNGPASPTRDPTSPEEWEKEDHPKPMEVEKKEDEKSLPSFDDDEPAPMEVKQEESDQRPVPTGTAAPIEPVQDIVLGRSESSTTR